MALNPKYMISPNLQEYFVDKTSGLPLSGGFVYYYEDEARSILKTVYSLSGSSGSYSYVALPNPVPLSGVGTTTDGDGNDIRVYYYPFDAENNIELYYIVVKDANGLTQLTRQAWPNLIAGDSTSGVYSYNFVRNNTFFSWSNSTVYTNVGSGSPTFSDFLIDDWSYQNSDSSQTINISQGVFPIGSASVDDNPPYYLIYENTDIGIMSSTYNQFQQYYQSVQTLSGKVVALSIWVNLTSPASVNNFSVTITQYYGSGSSTASVVTPIITNTILTASDGWVKLTGTITVPIASGTIGINGDDALILSINMPLNQLAKINIANIKLEQGITTIGTEEFSNDDIARGTNFFTYYPPFTTGDFKMTLKTIPDIGWLIMDDGTIGAPLSFAGHTGFSYFALYSLIWNNVHSPLYAPIFDSSGNPADYGSTAKDDWDDFKRLSLTKQLGRVISGQNPIPTGLTKIFVGSQSGSNLLITITTAPPSPEVYYTGAQVTFIANGGTLPTNLNPANQYWIGNVTIGGGSITFFVATTLANAIAGNFIGYTTSGSGNTEVIISNNNMGYYTGEFTHILINGELSTHSHPTPGGNFVIAGGGGTMVGSDVGISFGESETTGNQGNNLPHNNTQPTIFTNVMIKL